MFEMIDLPVVEQGNAAYEGQAKWVREHYAQLSGEHKALRAREIAERLGISEAQWVSANCHPIRSVRLKGTPQALFKEIGQLGTVMALTRNESCVHERHGEYLNIQAEGPVGLVLGPDIDLRAFFGSWRDIFAVEEGHRLSLQFFDEEGQAVHKVYCTEQTDTARYLALVQDFAGAPAWSESILVPKQTLSHVVSDVGRFRQAWLAMTDTHDFFGMLKKFQISRVGALQQAGSDLAQSVSVMSVETMLQRAAQTEIEIMCFVANRGMIQIHTGTVKKIVRRGPWLNVLDPTFNLHLNTTDIKQAWIVNKPTTDGWVTSLEVFDHNDELIVQFFGARKPGKPELTAWRKLLVSLCAEPLLG